MRELLCQLMNKSATELSSDTSETLLVTQKSISKNVREKNSKYGICVIPCGSPTSSSAVDDHKGIENKHLCPATTKISKTLAGYSPRSNEDGNGKKTETAEKCEICLYYIIERIKIM